MLTQKKLPIKHDTFVQTECWTHNKLSIIESTSKSDAWLASHFGIFMNSQYKVLFGKNNVTSCMSDCSDLLTFKEVKYWSVPPHNVVNMVINNISENRYIIIYLMTSVRPHQIHEFLFYGYDLTERVLYFSLLNNGNFNESKMTFEHFNQFYKNYYDYNLTFPDSLVDCMPHFYHITSVTVRKDYDTDLCLSEALYRFQEERYGPQYIYIANSEQNPVYTGVECLRGMKVRILQYIEDKQFIKDKVFEDLSSELQLNLYKLYEHAKIVHNSMLWISKTIKYNHEWRGVDEYSSFAEKIHMLALLSIKFKITENWDIVDEINNKLIPLYEECIAAMDQFLECLLKARKYQNITEYNELLLSYPNILNQRVFFKDMTE